METNFNFKSQIATSIEQSERLLALGLKKETADMTIHIKNDDSWYVTAEPFYEWEDDRNTFPCLVEPEPIIPAWSLHRLIELCSQQICIGKRKYFHTLHLINNEYVAYIDDIGDAYQYHDEGDLYNSLIRCIEWLIKEGYFNKEYLV